MDCQTCEGEGLNDIEDTKCARCGADLQAHTMSKFNTDIICLRCAEDERLAPGYAAAADAEIAAVRQGNYNFPGVGLSLAAVTFLATRRQQRTR
jgi:hypothetical protein